MIIEVNPNNSTDLYSLASQKQQVLQSHVLSIPSTGWTEDPISHIWSHTANFSPDFGAEIGLFDNPNLIASYTIPQGDMSNYNKCASCNVRVASIVLDNPSNYSAAILADLQPDINISLDFIIYGKNDSVGDKASDSVSQYIIEHCIAQYQASFAYKVGNMCYQDGVIYKCKANSTGNIPPNDTYWIRFDKDLQDRVLTLEQNYATLSVSDTITKTNLGSFTIDGTKLIKFANGAPSQSTSTIGNSSTPVYVNSGVLTACSNVVDVNSTQTISGSKTFTNRININSATPRISNSNEETIQVQRNDIELGAVTSPIGMRMTFYGKGTFQTSERIATFRSYMRDNGHNTLYLSQFYKSSDSLLSDGLTINVGTTRGNYITAPTPSTNSLNDVTVPNMEYLNSESKATFLVHRAGTETITGEKTFEIGSKLLILKHTLTDRSVVPTSSSYQGISFTDKNSNSLGGLRLQRSKEDVNGVYLHAYNRSGTQAVAGLFWESSQTNAYFTAPTPSDTAPNTAVVTKGYPKMVTTDTEQTLSAQKIIRRGGEPKIVLADTRGKTAETPSTTYYNDIRFADGESATQGQIRFAHRNNGSKSYTLRLVAENGTVVNTEIFGVNKTGEPYSFVPTPSANANSSSAVNIAYVSATDGTTNNLVHNIGNENIDGNKTFTKYSIGKHYGKIIGVTPNVGTNTGWLKIATWKAKNTTIMLEIVGSLNNATLSYTRVYAGHYSNTNNLFAIENKASGEQAKAQMKMQVEADETCTLWIRTRAYHPVIITHLSSFGYASYHDVDVTPLNDLTLYDEPVAPSGGVLINLSEMV